MKKLTLYDTNYTELFENNSNEPLIVNNSTGNQFLVMPLKNMHWKELFYYMYQLPNDLFNSKTEIVRDMNAVRKHCGSMAEYLSSSDEFASRKKTEKELEARKWKK